MGGREMRLVIDRGFLQRWHRLRYSIPLSEDGVENPSGEADDGRGNEDRFPIAVAEVQDEARHVNADEAGDGAGRVHHAE